MAAYSLNFNWIPLGLFIFAVYYFLKTARRYATRSRLRVAVQKRQKERAESFRELSDQRRGDDTELRDRILRMNFHELTDALQNEKVTCVEVLHAYQWKSLEAQQKVNCVTEFVKEAESWAEALDVSHAGSQNKPPLFGIPCSVKESIAIKGYDTTRGYAQFIGARASDDAVIVKTLKLLGAVPFVRGNVPQSLLSFNCANPIYGRTSNPHNPERTSGGSSGGDAANVAMGGSVFSIGGDVGGSIRIPAHFCGVAGIKPSHTRLSQVGSAGSVPGRPLICASCGPMARETDTVVHVMRHLLSSPQMPQDDYYTAPVPFREDIFADKKKLRIGFYDEDGWFEAVPACRRAVREAKEALERAGHTLVPFSPPDVPEAVALFAAAAIVDGGIYLLNTVNQDIPEPLNAPMMALYSIPHWLRYWLGVALRPFLYRSSRALTAIARDDTHMTSWVLDSNLARRPGWGSYPVWSTAELRQVYEKIGIYRKEFAREWRDSRLDCVICPVIASPALPHDVPMKTLSMVSWTGIYNLLDFAAGVVPWTSVTKEDERLTEEVYEIKDFMSRIVRNVNSSGAEGLPVGVQCVAPPFQEEVCLKLMKEVSDSRK